MSVSDFSVDDLMSARSRWSSQVVFTLARLGLQFPASLRLLDVCRDKAFVTWLYTERHKEIGTPLAGLRGRVGFDNRAGVVDYSKVGRYAPTYKLIKLKYSGFPVKEIDIDPNVMMISRRSSSRMCTRTWMRSSSATLCRRRGS